MVSSKVIQKSINSSIELLEKLESLYLASLVNDLSLFIKASILEPINLLKSVLFLAVKSTLLS